jgi:hypothetical protein
MQQALEMAEKLPAPKEGGFYKTAGIAFRFS